MLKKEDFSHEEWALLGLAGAFNAESARWRLRKEGISWQVIRETDEAYPNDIEVKGSFKTNGQAHDAMSTMGDIAAAKAFLIEFKKVLEQE